VLFHLFSPWWWTPIASNWRYIDDTITLTFWITGAVFCAVIAFMAYCVFRFHHKEGRRAAYNPENKKPCHANWERCSQRTIRPPGIPRGCVSWHRVRGPPVLSANERHPDSGG